MEKLTDKILLRTGFGKKILSKMIGKIIKDKFGKDVDVYIGDIDAEYSDGELSLSIKNCNITMSASSLEDLLNL